MKTSIDKWDAFFLQNARLVSSLSKDPSTKVGVVIVDQDRNVISTGYNGFPRGIPDKEEWYGDRETKIKYVEHAERNAIVQAANHGVPLKNCSIYSTHFSCMSCAKGVINAGIRNFIYICDPVFEARWDADEVKDFYRMAGVRLRPYTKEELNAAATNHKFTLCQHQG